MTPIFDTHAHYDDAAFEEDREELLGHMREQGVAHIVNVGASMQGCRDTLSLVKRFPDLYGALGVHPDEVGSMTGEDLDWIAAHVHEERIVAVGEIGLDYYWDNAEHDVQKLWFRRQLNLAREQKLPVIIHSRDAAGDTYELMKEEHAEEIGGVIHCFSYSKEMAALFLKMGFYIGIGGVVTFKNARKVKEAVEEIPLDRLVLETDSPYLSPDRGKRNDSRNISMVVSTIAQIKGITEEDVRRTAYKNACRLYRLPFREV